MTDAELTTLTGKAKVALNTTTEDEGLVDEIQDIIRAAEKDMLRVGAMSEGQVLDALIIRAIITYVRFSFGSPDNAETLHESYREQRDSLASSSGYTSWS